MYIQTIAIIGNKEVFDNSVNEFINVKGIEIKNITFNSDSKKFIAHIAYDLKKKHTEMNQDKDTERIMKNEKNISNNG